MMTVCYGNILINKYSFVFKSVLLILVPLFFLFSISGYLGLITLILGVLIIGIIPYRGLNFTPKNITFLLETLPKYCRAYARIHICFGKNSVFFYRDLKGDEGDERLSFCVPMKEWGYSVDDMYKFSDKIEKQVPHWIMIDRFKGKEVASFFLDKKVDGEAIVRRFIEEVKKPNVDFEVRSINVRDGFWKEIEANMSG